MVIDTVYGEDIKCAHGYSNLSWESKEYILSGELGFIFTKSMPKEDYQ